MKRLMCLLLAVAFLISSFRNCRIDVYADEEETTAEAGTSERGGGVHEVCTDDNFIGNLSDFVTDTGDYIISKADDVGNTLINTTVNAADFYKFVGTEMFATGADLYVNSMEYVADQIGDIGDKIKVFFDGKNLAYSVDSDLQQAVYDALKQYTADDINAVWYRPAYSVADAYSYRYKYETENGYSHDGSAAILESKFGDIYITKLGDSYDCVSFDFLVFDSLNSYGRRVLAYSYYNDGFRCVVSIDRIYNKFSISSGGYVAVYDQQYYRIYGDPCFLFDTVTDAVNYFEGKSGAYLDSSWSQSGTQYITNDGLNYDWAARNSRNYSTLVNAITDGTIVGQTMINNTLVDLSSDLDEIRETINEVSDDVSESTDILQNIYDLLKKYLPLLEDIKDSPSKILDGTSDSSVLSSIKRSVSQILALMYADQLTDLIDEYFGDDDDKDSYVEKSIGYVLLVLLIFVYLMKIFIHLLAFIVAFFNIEPALCSDFLPDEMYQGFQYLDEIMIPYLNMSVWDFEQLILYTVMIFYCIRLFVRHADRFKFE
jgi:uncharacterized protein YoxC